MVKQPAHCKALSVLLMLCVIWVSTQTAVFATDTPHLRLISSTEQPLVGQPFTVNIHVEGAANLYGLDLQLHFDPTLLQVVDSDQTAEGIQFYTGSFLDPLQSFELQNHVDNENGRIDYARTLLSPAPAAQGDGLVATITFTPIGTGTAPITIHDALFGTPEGTTIVPTLDNIKHTITTHESTTTAQLMLSPTPSSTTNNTPTNAPAARPSNSSLLITMLAAAFGGIGLLLLKKFT